MPGKAMQAKPQMEGIPVAPVLARGKSPLVIRSEPPIVLTEALPMTVTVLRRCHRSQYRKIELKGKMFLARAEDRRAAF